MFILRLKDTNTINYIYYNGTCINTIGAWPATSYTRDFIAATKPHLSAF